MTYRDALQAVREGLLEHSLAPDDRERCGECGMVLPNHTPNCHGAAAFAALDVLAEAVALIEGRG